MLRVLMTMAAVAVAGASAAAQPPPPPFPALGPPGGANLDLTNGPAVLAYIKAYVELVLRDPDASTSLARQQELELLLARLPTENAAQKDTLAAAAKGVRLSREKVAVQVTPLATFMQKVRDNPNDSTAVHGLGSKLRMEVAPLLRTKPDEGARILAEARPVLAAVERAVTSAETRRQLQRSLSWWEDLDKDVKFALDVRQKQRALLGQAAPPLKVETWINGLQLSAEDLLGRVILLDFVHAWVLVDEEWLKHWQRLSDWQKQYGDRGLVVVGLTCYANLRWPDGAARPLPVRGDQEQVAPADEQALLLRFVRENGLRYRLAILDKEEHIKLGQHYHSIAGPHLVVIDRQGKIRLIRDGTDEQATRNVQQLLESLLGESAPGK